MPNKMTLAVGTMICILGSMAEVAGAQPAEKPFVAKLSAATGEQVQSQLQKRGEGLVAMINGQAEPEAVFAKALLAQRPPERIKAFAGKLRGKLGAAVGVNRIEASSVGAGTIYIDFENGQLPFRVTLEEAAPHLLIGLGVSG